MLVYRIRAGLMRPRARGFNRPSRELGTKNRQVRPPRRADRQRHGAVVGVGNLGSWAVGALSLRSLARTYSNVSGGEEMAPLRPYGYGHHVVRGRRMPYSLYPRCAY